jgi:hypothetical protein
VDTRGGGIGVPPPQGLPDSKYSRRVRRWVPLLVILRRRCGEESPIDQIYKNLDELGMKMKGTGYKPATDVVLVDVEDGDD